MGITLDFCQAMLKREGIEKIDVLHDAASAA